MAKTSSEQLFAIDLTGYFNIPFRKRTICFSFLFAFLFSCNPNTPDRPFSDGDEEYHGLHPQAEAEMLQTYVDPATGEIPAGIRHRELTYINTLPKKSETNFRSGNDVPVQWYDAGPSDVGGRTRSLVFDAADAQTILAGGASGGVWKSTDGGESWHLKTAPGTHLNVSTLVQDPRPGHTATWYYGTGEIRGESGWDRGYTARNFGTGIYKSTDNGESWAVIPGSVPGNPTGWDGAFDFVHRMVINPVTGTRFIANNSSGIYRTEDDVNFPRVLGELAEHLYNDIAVSSDGKLVAVMSSLRTNWTHNNTGGLFISTNDGQAWEDITPATFPAQHHRSILAFAPSNPDILYVLTYTGNLLSNNREDIRFHYLNLAEGTSEDRTAFLPNLPGSNQFLGPSVQTHGSYCMTLGVRPDDENFVVLGGVSIFRSTNGFSEPIPADKYATLIGGFEDIDGVGFPFMFENHWVDHHVIVWHPENPSEMWNANDSGIYRSEDVDAYKVNWQDKSEGYNTTQYFTVTMSKEAGDGRIMAGAQDNGTRYFQEFGDPGAPLFTGGLEICAGDGSYGYFGEKFAYTSLQFGRARRANYLNAAQTQIQTHLTFTLANVAPPPAANTSNMFYIHPYVIDPNNERYMYFPEANTLWRNSNIEHSNPLSLWTKLTNVAAPGGYTITDLAVSMEPAHVLYIGATHSSQKPKIYRLENAISATDGLKDISIDLAPSGAYVHDIAVNPENADEVMVVLSNYNIIGLYHTDDGGDTWRIIEGNLAGDFNNPGPSLRSAAILPLTYAGLDETLYLVGTSSGLFSTTELIGGATEWEQEAFESMGNAIAEMIHARPTDGRIAVATFGRSVFIGDVDVESVATEQEPVENEIPLTVFPNPFAEINAVQFELKNTSNVTLELLDATGKNILLILENEKLEAGIHSYEFQTTHLPGGIYYMHLKNNDGVKKSKIEKLIRR